MLLPITNRKMHLHLPLYPWLYIWQTPCGRWRSPDFWGWMSHFRSQRIAARHSLSSLWGFSYYRNLKVEGWGHPIFDYQHTLHDRKDWT